jgi:hypothetical protein
MLIRGGWLFRARIPNGRKGRSESVTGMTQEYDVRESFEGARRNQPRKTAFRRGVQYDTGKRCKQRASVVGKTCETRT